MKHTPTHTYTHTNEITAVQKKKVKENDPASKGNQKLYQPIKRKLTKCKLENKTKAECQLGNKAKKKKKKTNKHIEKRKKKKKRKNHRKTKLNRII